MKKIFFLFALVFAFTSCATMYKQTVYVNDFRPYAEEGFTISTSYSGFTYESLGDIIIKFQAGIKKDYTNPNLPYENHFFTPNAAYMTAEAVKAAKELGADAILGFNIVSPVLAEDKNYFVTGLAVKLHK